MYPRSPLGDRDARIGTGRDVEWQPLVDYRRHDVSETTIHGAVAWASGRGIVHSFGGNVLCYGRSMMKPLMIKPLAAALDPVTTWTQRAIAVSALRGRDRVKRAHRHDPAASTAGRGAVVLAA